MQQTKVEKLKSNKAENPDALLEVFQEHEKAIAGLYDVFSHRFEQYAAFWAGLTREELQHAACLSSLRSQMEEDPDIVIVERFSPDAIKSSIRYVHELTERAGQTDFELINAFSLAAKLEEALLEKNFFEVLSGDTPEIKETLELLAHETQRHYQRLSSTLREYRAGGHSYT